MAKEIENNEYQANINGMLDIINEWAEQSMNDKPVSADITIIVSNTTNPTSGELVVPFNADSYCRLVEFLEQEAIENRKLNL